LLPGNHRIPGGKAKIKNLVDRIPERGLIGEMIKLLLLSVALFFFLRFVFRIIRTLSTAAKAYEAAKSGRNSGDGTSQEAFDRKTGTYYRVFTQGPHSQNPGEKDVSDRGRIIE
jgi:hypothetical protein